VTESADAVVFLHDPDPQMLENHCVPLLRQVHGIEVAGLELRPFQNRNELLAAIAAERRPSVALVDLQQDDRRDLNYRGHRIIETIRHHELLWRGCRPFAFSVHARADVLRLVEDHGAYGLIARNALDIGTDVGFPAQLREQLRRPARGPTQAVACQLLPTGHALDDLPVDDARTVEEIGKVFYRARDLNENQWMVLRYAAENVGATAIAAFIHQEFGIDGANPVEYLQTKLKLQYRVAGRPDLRAAALDLFQRLPHKRQMPDDGLSLRLLPRLRDLQDQPMGRLMNAGFLDAEARTTYLNVLSMIDTRALGNNAGADQNLEQIRGAIDLLVADAPEPQREPRRRRLERALIRAVYNLVDTDACAPPDAN
jgi:hypothetical protein